LAVADPHLVEPGRHVVPEVAETVLAPERGDLRDRSGAELPDEGSLRVPGNAPDADLDPAAIGLDDADAIAVPGKPIVHVPVRRVGQGFEVDPERLVEHELEMTGEHGT